MRLLKEREIDQDLWESLNFITKDDDDILVLMSTLVCEAQAATKRDGEVDQEATAREERARAHLTNVEGEAHEAREELKLARQARLGSKHRHSESKAREERLQKYLTTLRTHARRKREGIVEWGIAKGFEKDMLPELQLMARGGLRRLIDASHAHHTVDLSPAEAEAI